MKCLRLHYLAGFSSGVARATNDGEGLPLAILRQRAWARQATRQSR